MKSEITYGKKKRDVWKIIILKKGDQKNQEKRIQKIKKKKKIQKNEKKNSKNYMKNVFVLRRSSIIWKGNIINFVNKFC